MVEVPERESLGSNSDNMDCEEVVESKVTLEVFAAVLVHSVVDFCCSSP